MTDSLKYFAIGIMFALPRIGIPQTTGSPLMGAPRMLFTMREECEHITWPSNLHYRSRLMLQHFHS
jgi:hypothetical protein